MNFVKVQKSKVGSKQLVVFVIIIIRPILF